MIDKSSNYSSILVAHLKASSKEASKHSLVLTNMFQATIILKNIGVLDDNDLIVLTLIKYRFH